jgi:hypothetical protein
VSDLPGSITGHRITILNEGGLKIVDPCIQGNRELQTEVWEAFVECKRASLPDWTRPSLPDDRKLLRYFTMDSEQYIRDMPKK